MKNIIKSFEKRFRNSSLRNILFGMSGTESCLKHPDNSCGVMFRDQGQADLYAGNTRLILTEQGTLFLTGSDIIQSGARVYISVRDIENFIIQNKTIDKQVFNGQKIAVFNTDQLDNIRLVTDLTTDSQGGPITNTVPLTSIIEPRTLFNELKKQQTSQIEIFELVNNVLGWKR